MKIAIILAKILLIIAFTAGVSYSFPFSTYTTFDEFKEGISKIPSLTQQIISISPNDAYVFNNGWILFYDAFFRQTMFGMTYNPFWIEHICKVNGGSLYRAGAVHPITGERLSFDAYMKSRPSDIRGDYICESNEDRSSIFKVLKKFKREETGNILFILKNADSSLNTNELKKHKDFAEKHQGKDIINFSLKRVYLLDIPNSKMFDKNTVQRNSSYSSALTWQFFPIKIALFCAIKGGEMYKVSEGSLLPYSEFIYDLDDTKKWDWVTNPETKNRIRDITKVKERLAGQYLCKGGKEPFLMKITDYYFSFGNPESTNIELYVTNVVPQNLVSFPVKTMFGITPSLFAAPKIDEKEKTDATEDKNTGEAKDVRKE